jgi:hypothetical protein
MPGRTVTHFYLPIPTHHLRPQLERHYFKRAFLDPLKTRLGPQPFSLCTLCFSVAHISYNKSCGFNIFICISLNLLSYLHSIPDCELHDGRAMSASLAAVSPLGLCY